MNALRNVLICLLFTSTTAMAAPASDESIKELLAVTQAQKVLDSTRAQVDSLMNQAAQQALKGKAPTAKQQQAIAKMKSRLADLTQDEFAWNKVEPMYLRLYRESFTEEEVAGMLSFYKSAAGQAVVNKMPLLMQKIMVEIPRMLTAMAPRMKEIQKDFVAEMKDAGD